MAPERVREILLRYREGLAAALGNDLVRVILYGSHARDDAHGGSDIDVLCVMRRPFDHGKVIEDTSELTAALSLQYDAVLSRAFVTEHEYTVRQLPFFMNIRKEGIPV